MGGGTTPKRQLRWVLCFAQQPGGGELLAVVAFLDEGLFEGWPILAKLLPQSAHRAGLVELGRLLGQVAVEEEGFIVEQEFFEAGAGSVEYGQFGLGGRSRESAALGGVLATTARGHAHLVSEARTRVEELFPEPVGGVRDERGSLEAAGGAVAFRRAEAFRSSPTARSVRRGGGRGRWGGHGKAVINRA